MTNALGSFMFFYVQADEELDNQGNCTIYMYSRPPQIFFGKLEQTPRWSLGQNVTGHQFSAILDVV